MAGKKGEEIEKDLEDKKVVGDIMKTKVFTLKEEDTVEDCAKLLLKYNLSNAVIVDDEKKIIGLVTEGDIIRRASQIKGPSFIEVFGSIIYLETVKELIEEVVKSKGNYLKDIMTRDVITAKKDATVESIASLMVEKGLKTIPIVSEDGVLIGIVSRKDIINDLFMNSASFV